MEQNGGLQYPTWRKLIILVSCCVLYLGSFSGELTSGIPYSELLLAPCGRNELKELVIAIDSSLSNSSSADVPSPYSTSAAAVTTMTSLTTNSTDNNSSLACGGFGQGASKTAWVASIYSGVRVATCWLNGVLYDLFGGRKTAFLGLLFSLGCLSGSFAEELFVLYITRGAVSGLGGGIIHNLAVPILDEAFTERKIFVMTLAFASSGLGAVVLAFLGKAAVQYGGWRWYYILMCLVGVASMLVIPSLPARHEVYGGARSKEKRMLSSTSTDGGMDMNPNHAQMTFSQKIGYFLHELKWSLTRGLSLYKNCNFSLLVFGYFLLSLVFFYPILTVRQRALEFGDVPDDDSFLQIILVGAGSLAGGVVVALVVGFLPIPVLLVKSLAMLSAGIACALSSMIHTSAGLYFFVTVYAFLTHSLSSLAGPAVFIIVEKDQLPHASGQLILMTSFAIVVGPPAGGWLYEVTDSFTLPLIIAGVFLIMAGMVFLLIDLRIRCQKRRRELSSRTGENMEASRHQELVLNRVTSL